jgi:hypothetical protein
MSNNDHDDDDVINRLSVLAPGAQELPQPAKQSLAAIHQQIAARPDRRRGLIIRSTNLMSSKRVFAACLTLVLVVVALMAFPSVRAAASDFLGLFRVQKFAPISVSPEQMAVLEQLGEQGAAPGEFVTVKDPGEPLSVGTVEAAETLTGLDLMQMKGQDNPIDVYVTDDASGYLLVDLAGARAILTAAGVDPMLLPDSLDGATINVTAFDSVQQIYQNGVTFMQTPSPIVVYPENLDATVLGEAMLQVMGTEPESARQIAQSIDWTSTLLLPIPQDFATYRDVSVRGSAGVLLQPIDPEAEPAVVWQQDGMVYMMTGPVGADELLRLANTIR